MGLLVGITLLFSGCDGAVDDSKIKKFVKYGSNMNTCNVATVDSFTYNNQLKIPVDSLPYAPFFILKDGVIDIKNNSIIKLDKDIDFSKNTKVKFLPILCEVSYSKSDIKNLDYDAQKINEAKMKIETNQATPDFKVLKNSDINSSINEYLKSLNTYNFTVTEKFFDNKTLPSIAMHKSYAEQQTPDFASIDDLKDKTLKLEAYSNNYSQYNFLNGDY